MLSGGTAILWHWMCLTVASAASACSMMIQDLRCGSPQILYMGV